MKKFKLNEAAYTKAIDTLAKSLIAMAQEDYAEEFEGMDEEEVNEQLCDVVEEYSGDMLLDLKQKVLEYID